MRFADLHLHTVFSDGTLTPAQLISESHKCGLSAVAVVDHDTVDGISSALTFAQGEDIEVIPGIELTAEYQGLEIHILGYLIDFKQSALLERLMILKKNRVERIYKMVDKLKAMKVELKPEMIFDLAKYGTVGRLHVARAMLKEGLVNSVAEAFRKYIGDNCEGYVLGFRLSPQEAIALIKQARGIPVLGHPYTIRDDALVPEIIGYGIMGLEVHYPEHTQAMVNYYLGMAQKYNLLVTGGSDYHGDAKPQVKLGSMKIPYELVEKLKNAQRELKR